MSRSLKKGPFIDEKLLKKVLDMNKSGGQKGHQDLGAAVDDFA